MSNPINNFISQASSAVDSASDRMASAEALRRMAGGTNVPPANKNFKKQGKKFMKKNGSLDGLKDLIQKNNTGVTTQNLSNLISSDELKKINSIKKLANVKNMKKFANKKNIKGLANLKNLKSPMNLAVGVGSAVGIKEAKYLKLFFSQWPAWIYVVIALICYFIYVGLSYMKKNKLPATWSLIMGVICILLLASIIRSISAIPPTPTPVSMAIKGAGWALALCCASSSISGVISYGTSGSSDSK